MAISLFVVGDTGTALAAVYKLGENDVGDDPEGDVAEEEEGDVDVGAEPVVGGGQQDRGEDYGGHRGALAHAEG